MNEIDNKIHCSVAFFQFKLTPKDCNKFFAHLYQQEVYKSFLEKTEIHNALYAKVLLIDTPEAFIEIQRQRIENINAVVKYVREWLKANIEYDYEEN